MSTQGESSCLCSQGSAQSKQQVSRPGCACCRTASAKAYRWTDPLLTLGQVSMGNRGDLGEPLGHQGEHSAPSVPDRNEGTGLTDVEKGKEWAEPC